MKSRWKRTFVKSEENTIKSIDEATNGRNLKAGVNFFKDFIYLFLEIGEARKTEGEKYQCVVASWAPPTGARPTTQHVPLTGNGTCPSLSQAGAQSTKPHQPALMVPLPFSLLPDHPTGPWHICPLVCTSFSSWVCGFYGVFILF